MFFNFIYIKMFLLLVIISIFISPGSFRTAGRFGCNSEGDSGRSPGGNNKDDESTGWCSAAHSWHCPTHQRGKQLLCFICRIASFIKLTDCYFTELCVKWSITDFIGKLCCFPDDRNGTCSVDEFKAYISSFWTT